MKPLMAKATLASSLMALAASVAAIMTPTRHMSSTGVDLDAMIPARFGEWRMGTGPLLVAPLDPAAEASSKRIYDQVLMRTYADSAGDQVMLAIAYGSDQSDRLKVHRPEVCYRFQGFRITDQSRQIWTVGDVQLPIQRLIAINGTRVEPVTYWIKVGDNVVDGGLERKLMQLRYGLVGTVPEGVLLRVSSINKNAEVAFRIHKRFIKDLLAAMNSEALKKLIGKGGRRV